MCNQSCKPDLGVTIIEKLSEDLYRVNGKYYQRAEQNTIFSKGQVVFVNSKRNNNNCYANNKLVVIENDFRDSGFVLYESGSLWKDSCFVEVEIVPVESVKKGIVAPKVATPGCQSSEASLRHPHADLMIQYANDTTLKIELYNDKVSRWIFTPSPTWNPKGQYRIKPKTKKVTKYKYAYLNVLSDNYSITSSYLSDDKEFKQNYYGTNEFERLDFTAKEFEVPND